MSKVIKTVNLPGSAPKGITWAKRGEIFYFTDTGTDLIYLINADVPNGATVRTIKSFSAPGTYPNDVSFDGRNLWVSDMDTDLIYKLNPDNGRTISSFSASQLNPTGIVAEGKTLWEGHGWINKVNIDTGTLVSVVGPNGRFAGLEKQGNYFYYRRNYVCYGAGILSKGRAEGNGIRDLIYSTTTDPQGCAVMGNRVYVIFGTQLQVRTEEA